MRVRRLMSAIVHSCSAEQTLAEAAQLLWEHDVGCVPIIDDGGRPIAMVTDRDICMAAFLRGRPIAELPIASAMSPELYTCHEADPIEEAERTMMRRQVRRLPVVDDGGVLVGVLSVNDILLARTRSTFDKMRERLRGHVVETLAGISKHRDEAVAAE